MQQVKQQHNLIRFAAESPQLSAIFAHFRQTFAYWRRYMLFRTKLAEPMSEFITFSDMGFRFCSPLCTFLDPSGGGFLFGLIAAGDITEGDAEAIPAVNQHDSQGQIGQFFLAEVLADNLKSFVGDVGF